MINHVWSILVASVPERMPEPAGSLLAKLSRQISDEPVELLWLLDNRRRSVGSKRNALLSLSKGQFVSFVDDDDDVADNYVYWILQALKYPQTDVTCFLQTCEHVTDSPLGEKGYTVTCRYSLKTPYREGRNYDPVTGDPLHSGWWEGYPAHSMVWRGSIARQCRFPDENFGEDVAFVHQARTLARTEIHIPEVLYHYRFDASRSLTRG